MDLPHRWPGKVQGWNPVLLRARCRVIGIAARRIRIRRVVRLMIVPTDSFLLFAGNPFWPSWRLITSKRTGSLIARRCLLNKGPALEGRFFADDCRDRGSLYDTTDNTTLDVNRAEKAYRETLRLCAKVLTLQEAYGVEDGQANKRINTRWLSGRPKIYTIR